MNRLPPALPQRYAPLVFNLCLPLLLWQLGDIPPLLLPGATAATGLVLWYWHYRQYRHVADTPTSRASSAAQGYSECYGQAAALGGLPLHTPCGNIPCVWYQSERRYRGSGYRQRPQQQQRSDDSFRLLDRHGEILIQPDGASVEALHVRRWRDGDDDITEYWIADGDPLYVLGELYSQGGQPDRQAFRDDLQLTLNEWKRDRQRLLQRFDSNGDGQISEQEWEQARLAAHAEVGRNHRALAALPPSLHLRRPGDRRPFLISWRTPQDHARLLRRLAWSHAALALCATVWLAHSAR